MRSLRTVASKHGWLLLLVAATVTAMTAAIVFAFGDGDHLPVRANFVCVETGETFDLAIAQVGLIPARHPVTKRRTLLPCAKGESGTLQIDEHYRPVLSGRLGKVNRVIDAESLQVKRTANEAE